VGVLTDTMTRLRDEIVSSRHARVALLGDLVRQTSQRYAHVSALCAGFARDREGAHLAWFGPALSAERPSRRSQPARAGAAAEKQPPAAPKAKQRRRAPAKPSPRARRPLSKGSKKR